MSRPWRRLHRVLCLSLAIGLAACSDNASDADTQSTPFAALSCSQSAGTGWCWQRPQRDGFDVQDIYFFDAQKAWAVGENGHTWRSEDGGANWAQGSVGLRTRLSRVAFTDALKGWALSTQSASLLRTTDGGRNWAATTPPPMQRPLTLRVAGSQLLVVSGFVIIEPRGTLVPTTAVSEDGGTTWHLADRGTVDVVQDSGVLWSQSLRSLDAGRSFSLHPAWPTVTLGGVIGAAGAKVGAVAAWA